MKRFFILAPRILNSLDLDWITRTPETVWQQVAVHEGDVEVQSRKLAELARDLSKCAIGQDFMTWNKIIGVSEFTASVLLVRNVHISVVDLELKVVRTSA